MKYLLCILPTLFYSFVQINLRSVATMDFSLSTERRQIFVLLIISSILMVSGLLIWIKCLSQHNLSQIYWITAISYIFVPFLSYFVLKEPISTASVLGYLVITLGVVISASASVSQ